MRRCDAEHARLNHNFADGRADPCRPSGRYLMSCGGCSNAVTDAQTEVVSDIASKKLLIFSAGAEG
jgi:hypothetical protein